MIDYHLYITKVILGGGREKFMPNTQRDPETNRIGSRKDGRDLIQEWVATRAKLGTAKYVWEKAGFDAINSVETDYLMGNVYTLEICPIGQLLVPTSDRYPDTWQQRPHATTRE